MMIESARLPSSMHQVRPCACRALTVLLLAGMGLGAALAAKPARADAPAVLDLAGAKALVAAPDRTEADRKQDARRHPELLLEFAQIGPGMTAADFGAGGGYTTELLARAVGPTGRVYGHNTPFVIENYVSESWPARLARPVNANVTRVDASFDHPLPRGTKDVDVITMVYVYHDWYLSQLGDFDQRLVLRRIYKALAPGGRIVLVDHRAAEGARGADVADVQHRIDEDRVKKDFKAAGFELEATADFMANPEDPRTEPFFKMNGPTDTFVHLWVRPAN